MRNLTAAIVLALFTPIVQAGDGDGNALVSEVVRNYDGDTLTVNVDQWSDIIGHEMPIHVCGVDTPVIRGDCEQEERDEIEARDFVADMLADAYQVILRNVDRDSFFRIVATVEIDGVDLTGILIDEGLGVPYKERDQAGWCEK